MNCKPVPALMRVPLLAALLLAALASAASSARAVLPPLETGVSYVYQPDPLEFAHVKAAGAKLVQTPVRWATVAPAKLPGSWNPEDPADPHYDWGDLDAWVRGAVAAGLTPLLQVRGAPAWAQRCTGRTDAPCDTDPAALAAFTKAAVRRYSGGFGGLPRVRYWQGMNEPNLDLFFKPQYVNGKAASPSLYRRLINSFYAAVKSVDPSALVLSAGLGPIAQPPYAIGPLTFTRKLLCMKGGAHPRPDRSSCEGGVHFDIFDMHPYTSGGPTHQGPAGDVELGDIPKLQALLAAADRAGRIKGAFRRTPLWITEMSWDSKPPDPGGVAMRTESQWIGEALYRSWKAGVHQFFWFTIVDFNEPDVPNYESIQAGLYFWAPSIAAQQPKEILFAFRFPFVAFARRDGLYFWGRTPASRGGRVAIQALAKGGWRTLSVARADSRGMFAGTLPSRYGHNKRGAVRARYRGGEVSLAFPMRRVGDRTQFPFGIPSG
ncbi:MAG: hypothetical protein ACJ76D_03645 [Solirubrobacterales bacterium]